jgi:hypothetical protein
MDTVGESVTSSPTKVLHSQRQIRGFSSCNISAYAIVLHSPTVSAMEQKCTLSLKHLWGLSFNNPRLGGTFL